jgi:hypothetical protein
MHKGAAIEIKKWYQNNKQYLDTIKIAELGSYDINGSVKDIIPNTIGFDILEGKGVDIVITPGIITEKYKQVFGALITTSAFQCCPDITLFKTQVLDLLKPEGLFILTMCPDSCNPGHSTSPNEYKFRDSIRMSQSKLREFWEDEFNNIKIFENNEEHATLILTAVKK